MKLARLALMVFLFWIAFAPVLQAQPQDEGTFSENKKFVVEISEAEVNNPKLTVFKVENEVRSFHWTKSLISKEESETENFFPPGYQHEFNRWVSDDGSVVILRKGHSLSGEDLFLRALRKDGSDKSFTMVEFLDPVVDSIEQDLNYIELDEPLELFLIEESPATYAYWDTLSGRWLQLDLTSLELSAPSGDREKKLNSLALARARESVRKHQPETVSKMLAPVKAKAQQLLPGLMPQETEHSDQMPVGAYRFLAKQKQPEDKRWIEKLLQHESSHAFFGGPVWIGVTSAHYSPERALGDELLAQWDGKSPGAPGRFGQGDRTPVYLAQVIGTVRLPFASPEKGGNIRVFLIPNELKGAEWPGSEKVITITHALEAQKGMWGGAAEVPETSQVHFSFNTLTPGAYRLKAIWDKRPPHSEGIAAGGELASAGDYESSETAALDLKAGSPVRDVILQCTNRVGQAAEYFAADDLWKAKNPPWYEDALEYTPEKVLFTAPVSDWIAATNQNPSNLRFKSISYLEEAGGAGMPRSRALRVTFTVPREPGTKPKANRFSSHEESLFYSGALIDSHGCKFESGMFGQSDRLYEMSFPIVPLGDEQFRLQLKVQGSDSKEKVAAILQLRNLIKPKPAALNTRPLPVTNVLGTVAVSLDELPPDFHEIADGAHPRAMPYGFDYVVSHGQAFRAASQPKFRFATNNQPVAGWKRLSGLLSDRWGNLASSLNEFCIEEEEFSYRATFVRDEMKGSFREDEKWEVALKKVPGPGESVALDTVKEIQGANFQLYSVGGTGEFTYKRGALVSATNEIEELPERPPAFGPQRGIVPKLYIKSERATPQMQMMGMGMQGRSSELTLVSKIPHLVCRFPQPSTALRYGLLEQDLSVPEPRDLLRGPHFHGPISSQSGGPQFVALDYRPGETDKKITLIVQKPVVAEFAIKVPKGSRRKPGTE